MLPEWARARVRARARARVRVRARARVRAQTGRGCSGETYRGMWRPSAGINMMIARLLAYLLVVTSSDTSGPSRAHLS